jgi:hypothetical protein
VNLKTQIGPFIWSFNSEKTTVNEMPKPSKPYHLLGFVIKSIQILVTTAGFKPSAETPIFYGDSRNSSALC